ncbi:MAG: type I restriction endonuclease subunit R [Candidatus Nanohaloarchaea archaeon]
MNEFGLSEDPILEYLQEMGYEYKHGQEISPGGENPERDSYSEVVLRERLKRKLREINPDVPEQAINDAISSLLGFNSPKVMKNNKDFHEKLVNGVKVEYEQNGEKIGDRVQVIADEAEDNDFLAVNQFRVKIGENTARRPDIVLFLNGLPVGILELKDPTNHSADLKTAYKQVMNKYQRDIPKLFHYTEFVAVADMDGARIGTLDTPWEWFSNWNYVEDEGDTRPEMSAAEVLVRGAFDKERMTDLIQNYILFTEEDGEMKKILAAYHQYYSVERAIDSTKNKLFSDDRRIGTVWHTQGSGKSFSMVFYANKARRLEELENPTIVVVTDRTALDNQIKETFDTAGFRTSQANSKEELRDLLQTGAGGLIFTLVHKFNTDEDENHMPELNDRENVIVIADEAHRTQYKALAEQMRKYALPNASFLGFTATPIEKEDRSTYTAFGNVISEYTIPQSVADGSTVPIYYESRMAKLQINDEEIKEQFDELMESKSDDLENKMAGRWSRLRKIIENNDERFEKISEDIVEHFNNRDLKGKGMVVAISRKAAYKYKQHIDEIEGSPETAVVITNPEQYIDDPESERKLKKRFKDPEDPLRIAIVCQKWTTGFDVPCLHTMYIDRPMKNHNLMQTIGRVNRVYKDKPGGLIVDYIGIGDNLRQAMDKFTTEVRERTLQDIDSAVEQLEEKHAKVSEYFQKTDYEEWPDKRGKDLTRLIRKAENEVLEQVEEEKEFYDDVKSFEKAYTLISPHQEALRYQEDKVFFEAVRDSLKKVETLGKEGYTMEEEEKTDSAMERLVSEEIDVEKMVDIVGIEKDYDRRAVLSQEFMEELAEEQPENVRLKILKRIVENEIEDRKIKNMAKYESFEERLDETLNKYHQNFLTTKEVIKQLEEYANELREEAEKEEEDELTPEERAFYDAISEKGDKKISEEELKEIATELKTRLKDKADIDWTSRRSLKSEMRSEVKSILRNRGFKPSEYDPLVDPIVKQAEQFYGEEAVA